MLAETEMEANLKIDKASKTAELELGGSLTIQHAAELKKVLIETLEEAETLLLDLDKVQAFDLSSIQLIYATHIASVNSNKMMSFKTECPDRFREAVENAGFSWATWLCFGEKQV